MIELDPGTPIEPTVAELVELFKAHAKSDPEINKIECVVDGRFEIGGQWWPWDYRLMIEHYKRSIEFVEQIATRSQFVEVPMTPFGLEGDAHVR